MSRDMICSRVVDNLEDIKREREKFDSQMADIERLIARRERELANELTQSVGGGIGVGRRPAASGRGGRAGALFDIATGIGGALLSDNSRRIRELQDQIVNDKIELGKLRRKIDNLEQNVRRLRGDFNKYQCYALGYSHEVLNTRSTDGAVDLQYI